MTCNDHPQMKYSENLKGSELKMINKIDSLLGVMKCLRDPKTGCPWDQKQTFESIVPYTIEEAYEVQDAITRGDIEALKSELGDLLFQVVFYSEIAAEDGQFTFSDVIDAITEKMIRRHPHVFGDTILKDGEARTNNWESHKAEERRERALSERRPSSILDDVPINLPALKKAEKLTKRAARVGFDWPRKEQVIAKIDEELLEVKEEIYAKKPIKHIEEEIGDLLFTIANLARHFKIDPENALTKTNQKFIDRFHFIESELADANLSCEDAGLEAMENLWQTAKALSAKKT